MEWIYHIQSHHHPLIPHKQDSYNNPEDKHQYDSKIVLRF